MRAMRSYSAGHAYRCGESRCRLDHWVSNSGARSVSWLAMSYSSTLTWAFRNVERNQALSTWEAAQR